MYDAATEMKATAAGYMRISDVNAQGSNYQEAHVQKYFHRKELQNQTVENDGTT